MIQPKKQRSIADLKDIAQKVRKSFEEGEIEPPLLERLYSTYNPIQDMPLFIQRSRDVFPKSNCGIASLYLQHILEEGEIVQGEYAGNNHTFLMVGPKIIDITSDQYGGPKVYVGPIKTPWKRN